MSARDRVLDALQQLLVDDGPHAVTLERVAERAGVSKGGLLYHFGSKRELFAGLVDRLGEQTEREVAEAEAAAGGVVRHYLETSSPSTAEAASYWAVIAALRGRDEAGSETSAALAALFDRWREVLHDHVDDPVLADVVRLVGDGMYLSVLLELPVPSPQRWAEIVERLAAETDGR